MFSVKVSAVRNLMVVGKLLILLAISPAHSQDLNNPRFFEYKSNSFVNRLSDLTFGFFKTLNERQKAAYHQSIVHALEVAENGQRVTWYVEDASGYSQPVVTWPTGSGYCRRLHIQAIAYGVEKTFAKTACYDAVHNNWIWAADKY